MIDVFDAHADDYGLEDLMEQIFGDMTAGEIIADMYEYGMIPNEVIERFLEENGDDDER